MKDIFGTPNRKKADNRAWDVLWDALWRVGGAVIV
jgi:hypothetical protein